MALGKQLALDFAAPPADERAERDGLPDGWALRRLKDLVTITGGGTPSKSNGGYWHGAIPWVTPKDMKVFELLDSQDHISDAALAESTVKLIPPGSVLVVFRSGILSHTLPVAINRVRVTLNQDMKALTPCNEITSEYLAHYLRSIQQHVLAIAQKQGATVQSIDTAKFFQISIPIPPLPEQRRIVARVDELAARIEQARGLRREAMDEVAAAQKANAERWFAGIGAESWPTLSQVVAYIENGWSPQCLPEPAGPEEWGVLKVGAVSTGRFVPAQTKRLPPELPPRPELEIRHGDFLMGRANTTGLTGACAIVVDPPPRLLLCDKIFRFRFKPEAQIDIGYLDYALKSKPLRRQIEAVATGTSSSMKNISKDKVLRLRLPLPALSEQRHIVAYLDSLGTKADVVKRLQAESAAELAALLPAVLARAFKGNL